MQGMVQHPYTQVQAGGQTVGVPSNSGVNIQIFNPSVMTPGIQPPVYNVNAPHYHGIGGTGGVGGEGTGGANANATATANVNAYPGNYYTDKFGPKNDNANGTRNETNTNTTITHNSRKTEKRKVVELTDDYIRNLENYLNSQDKEVRLMGAKEVVERLTEDDSRCTDKALNALVNKMIQDPSTQIRLLGLSMLDARLAVGDDFTVKTLKEMQNSTAAYGHDAVLAANILLKMSGKQVEKEFEVKTASKKEADNVS